MYTKSWGNYSLKLELLPKRSGFGIYELLLGKLKAAVLHFCFTLVEGLMVDSADSKYLILFKTCLVKILFKTVFRLDYSYSVNVIAGTWGKSHKILLILT